MGRAGRRGAGMAAASAVGALGLWWLAEAAVAVARAVGAASPATPDEVLTLVAAVAALAVGTWLLVGFTLSVLAHLPGAAGDLARRVGGADQPGGGATGGRGRGGGEPVGCAGTGDGHGRRAGSRAPTRVGRSAFGGRRGTGRCSALPRSGSDEPLGDRHPVSWARAIDTDDARSGSGVDARPPCRATAGLHPAGGH